MFVYIVTSFIVIYVSKHHYDHNQGRYKSQADACLKAVTEALSS
jgi:hypothetical protein